MSATPDLLNLFTEPSVALLYFLSVILLSQAALFMALGQRLRGRRENSASRYAQASLGVMLSWMVLMVGAIVVLVTRTPSGLILPPLDRAVSAMVVLLVGWAFLTANQQHDDQSQSPWLTILVVLLAVAIIVGYGYTASQWYKANGSQFNLSIFNLAWTIATAVLTVFMLLLLLLRFRSTVDAPLKILFFAFVLAGYGYTLFSLYNKTLTGDDVGVLRLALLAAMPFLPIVVYRLVIDRLLAAVEVKSAQVSQVAQAALSTQPLPAQPGRESPQDREAMQVLRALGTMIERESPEAIPVQIVMAVAAALKADVAALLILDDAEYADVIAAYDNIQQKSIVAMAIKMDEQPTLVNAIVNKKQETLSTDRNLNELVDLYTRLDIQKIGPAYIQPLSREGGSVGALVIALPYTQRLLRINETTLLEALAPIASRLLGISRTAQRALLESEGRAVQAIVEGGTANTDLPPSAARAEMQASLELARSQINELSSLVRDLQIELDYERGRVAERSVNDPEGLSITQRMAKMSAERAQLEAEREKLMQALQEAQTQLASASGNEDEVYGAVIRVIQQERDELQAQKQQLEAQLTDIRSRGEGSPTVLRDLLTNMSEEKARLTVERDQIKEQLITVEAQLKALGIEGGSGGLVTSFAQLLDERSQYKALAERAVQERDTLLAERQKLADQIANEAKREAQIAAMETELRRLAEDREALIRQRDSLRQERGSANSDREKWESQRAKMVADMATLNTDLEEAVFERNRAIAERKKLAEERTQLQTERDRMAADRQALQTERDQLMARIEGNREVLQKLGADGVGALKAMIDDLTEERSDLEYRLLQAQTEIRTLEESLGQAESKLKKSVPVPTSSPLSASETEVMLSIAQELRTPMSSIEGYIDLLLGESVGILGELQRRFLSRVKANADRLGALLEDFIRVTALDTGQLSLAPENVDMIDVIDDAITSTRTQFREKGITLKMDLPDSLPLVRADRDALQQIVIQLLSNAYLASPTDSAVALQARYERNYGLPNRNGRGETKADVIYLAVRDTGGGIPPEEQNRVFSRLYRADNPLIQGLGDTGVGLSIARALTEVHGGRIWLESTPGVGSTFKVVIPLDSTTIHAERIEHAAS